MWNPIQENNINWNESHYRTCHKYSRLYDIHAHKFLRPHYVAFSLSITRGAERNSRFKDDFQL